MLLNLNEMTEIIGAPNLYLAGITFAPIFSKPYIVMFTEKKDIFLKGNLHIH